MYHLYSYSYESLIYSVCTPEEAPAEGPGPSFGGDGGGGGTAPASKVVLSERLTLSTSRYQCNVSVLPIYHYINLPAADFSLASFISLSHTLSFPSVVFDGHARMRQFAKTIFELRQAVPVSEKLIQIYIYLAEQNLTPLSSNRPTKCVKEFWLTLRMDASVRWRYHCRWCAS